MANVRFETKAPRWAEAVFHVLAQLPVEGVPAALYARWYVGFVEATLGPARLRPLGHDLVALEALARDHRTLCLLQGLAWLWREDDEALRCAERELSDMHGSDVRDPALLRELSGSDAPVELLRCAALLELDAYRRLPPAALDHAALEAELRALVPAAPRLAFSTISTLRPLTTHGRVRGSEIWVGVPGAGVTLQHAALQAAHEATVAEVCTHARALPERQIESVALVLFASRIAGSPLSEAHRAWCADSGVRASDLQTANLTVMQRHILKACLS